MIERGKTANPPEQQISLYWPEVKWIKTIFFPYLSLLGPGGTILQDELSALQNYLSSGYNKRWVPARTPDMSTSHPCRGVGISTSGLVPFCQDWKQNTPEHHQGSIPKALVSSQISGMSNQQSWDSSEEAFEGMKPSPGPAQRPPGSPWLSLGVKMKLFVQIPSGSSSLWFTSGAQSQACAVLLGLRSTRQTQLSAHSPW